LDVGPKSAIEAGPSPKRSALNPILDAFEPLSNLHRPHRALGGI